MSARSPGSGSDRVPVRAAPCPGRRSRRILPPAAAIGRDLKGTLSVACYLVAMPLALVQPWMACAIYVLVAIIWLVPDRRIERALGR